jgi:hypothetical protein
MARRSFTINLACDAAPGQPDPEERASAQKRFHGQDVTVESVTEWVLKRREALADIAGGLQYSKELFGNRL